MQQADVLKNKIRLVFEKNTYPGDDKLVRTDTDLLSYEYREVLKTLKGKRGPDLTIEVVRPIRWLSLGCLTFEAFRYYLPSFLIMAIDHYPEMDTLLDSLIWHLMPDALLRQIYDRPEGIRSFCEDILKRAPELKETITKDVLEQMGKVDEFSKKISEQPDEFSSRIDGLTADQRCVILSFLEYMNREHRADLTEEVIDPAIDVWRKLTVA